MMDEPPETGDLTSKSDRELFILIQLAGRNSPASREAFAEIHRRYAESLQRFCRATFATTLRRAGDVNDFVQEVFMEFWESRIFAFDCSRADSDATMTKLVRAWLAQLGKWVISRWRRKNDPEKSPVPVTNVELNVNEIVATRSLVTTHCDGEFSESVADALSQLTIRERDVVVTCTKHFDPVSKQCRVEDRAVKDRLMRDHDFKNWDAVRQCLKALCLRGSQARSWILTDPAFWHKEC